jgi:lipopolysaccharide transport system permease protein
MNTPEVHITRITPGPASLLEELQELWYYRELLYFLTLREIKLRYKQTAIGVAWVVLQPLITTAVFTLIFSGWARFDTGQAPYPLFALSGLLVWLFTYSSITLASNSFVSNANLVTKVYFPRIIAPVSAVLSTLVDLAVSSLLLLLLMFYYGQAVGVSVVLAPLFIALAIVLAAAVGVLLSALNVRFRDVKFALPFMLQIWMIASPVFYPLSIVPEKWRPVFSINPLTGILEGLRSSLFGYSLDWTVISISAVSLAVILALSVVVFKRMENDFADLI